MSSKSKAAKSPRRVYSVIEQLEGRMLYSGAQVPNSWTTVTAGLPNGDLAGVALLQPNGTVLVHGGGDSASANWYRLTPDATGGYVSGTWTQIPSMITPRLFFESAILPNDEMFVAGGEYTQVNGFTQEDDSPAAEIYDPAINNWLPEPSNPMGSEGDVPEEVLPDGNVLVGDISTNGTEIFDPTTGSWSTGPTKVHNDESDEEAWIKLPDGSILTYDIFSSLQDGVGEAERFIPTMNGGAGGWVDASTGDLPLLSTTDEGFELGAPVLLNDGRALFFGANGQTAFYNSQTGVWAPGPHIPHFLTEGDAPSAMLPNGQVLISLSPVVNGFNENDEVFPGPNYIYLFNPANNSFRNITPGQKVLNHVSNSFVQDFLVLPTGQIMVTDFQNKVAIYTPGGTAPSTSRPTVFGITNDGGGVFTLSGTQLNGLNEGAYYGDDNQMASNFPIVRVTDVTNGNVYYATTFNWSSEGVATGNTLETVNFSLPSQIGSDSYVVSAIANGITDQPTGAPVRLVFQNQPIAAWQFGPIPTFKIGVEDEFGNITSTSTGRVRVTIETGPVGAKFVGGTLSVRPVNGIATFSGLALDTPGTYTLAVNDGTLSQSVSVEIQVVALPPEDTQFIFNTLSLSPAFRLLREKRVALELSQQGPPPLD